METSINEIKSCDYDVITPILQLGSSGGLLTVKITEVDRGKTVERCVCQDVLNLVQLFANHLLQLPQVQQIYKIKYNYLP